MKLVVPLMMPADPFDTVGSQAFAQRLDDGDATSHGCLERNHHALLLGGRKDLGAMHGKQAPCWP